MQTKILKKVFSSSIPLPSQDIVVIVLFCYRIIILNYMAKWMYFQKYIMNVTTQ